MKYDDASWHYGGNFPTELPPKAGATHIGMFVAWLLLSGFENPEEPIDFDCLKNRTQTPGEFLMTEMDEKFVNIFFSEEGNLFTTTYYGSANGPYIDDYGQVLSNELPTEYHVEDRWENYDLLKPTIDRRYAEWKAEVSSL